MLTAMGELTTADGVRLSYRVDGGEGAPAVVLLHGLGSDGAADQALVEALGDRLRVIRLDLRGHGHSEPLTDRARYGWFLRAAADVAELLDHLGIAAAALYGGSLGAAVATAAALRHPERVRALGLSSVAIGAGADLGNPVVQGFAAGVEQLGLLGLLDSLADAGALTLTADEVAAARANFERQDDAAMRACVSALLEARLLDDLSELAAIHCPTLVIARRDDPLHPFALGAEFARRIPGARFVEDDGVLPLYLRPHALADLLVGFYTTPPGDTGVIGRGTKAFDVVPARGTWRRLDSPDDVLALLDGTAEGVVACVADAGATFLAPIFDELAAIVCLSGTPLSHIGIVSREYQVPCIMAAQLEAFPDDGDRVEVDCSGADGVVRRA
jgi:3-oxoadipate enol-lactonase